MKCALTIYPAMALLFILTMAGCTDPNAVIDQNTSIINNNWAYVNKLRYTVKIDNADIPYNLYLNLRVTADYKYSNLFILLRQTNPDKKMAVLRYEFKLANAAGEWLGNGSGNIYSYQTPFHTHYKFPVKGIYYFEIEQNMRDNPLREVSDVGLRVEKATP
jgi:gliding motility-associated lipoprotein GldH